LPNDKFTKCGNLTTIPEEICYPVKFDDWHTLYRNTTKDEVLEKIKKVKPYFIHLWNKAQTVFDTIKLSKDSAYVEITKKYCPKSSKVLLKMFDKKLN
jgi:hypothetical protein